MIDAATLSSGPMMAAGSVSAVLTPGHYASLAAAVMLAHLLLVAFVVLGLPTIVIGNRLGWRGANAPAWRWLHLAAIVIVAAEAWLGIVCPLTALERWLARRAGGLANEHPAGFIASWVQHLLYHDLPPAVFTAIYTAFAIAVIAAWWAYPPRRLSRFGPER